jgi:hypothetical protein
MLVRRVRPPQAPPVLQDVLCLRHREPGVTVAGGSRCIIKEGWLVLRRALAGGRGERPPWVWGASPG